MRKILLSLIVGLSSFAGMSQASNYPAGSTVDDFTVTDTDGNVHNLYDITASGKIVVMDFFFDTCGPCQNVQAMYNEFHDKYGCNTGDIFCITMNDGTDSDAEVIAYENTYGGSFSHAPAVSADGGGGDVTTAFGVSAFPTIVMIGTDNKMIVNDIWPFTQIGDIEGYFPSGSNPAVMSCSSAAGVEETVLENLYVYPNPASQELNFNFSSTIDSEAIVEVYNIIGEVVLTYSFDAKTGANAQTLNINSLPNGQYIAKVTMENQVSNIKFNVLK